MDTANVDTVIIAGRAMKRDGKLLHVDWGAVKRMTNASRDYVIENPVSSFPRSRTPVFSPMNRVFASPMRRKKPRRHTIGS